MGKILMTLQIVFCTLLFGAGLRGLIGTPLLWPATVLGIAISSAGVWSMQKTTNRIRITPEPYQGTPLCDRGIYHYIRHPMYSGLLITFAMFAIACHSWWRRGNLAGLSHCSLGENPHRRAPAERTPFRLPGISNPNEELDTLCLVKHFLW